LWKQIVGVMTKYKHDANKKTANVISTPDKFATTGFPMVPRQVSGDRKSVVMEE